MLDHVNIWLIVLLTLLNVYNTPKPTLFHLGNPSIGIQCMLTQMLSYYTFKKRNIKCVWPNDGHVHYTAVNTV